MNTLLIDKSLRLLDTSILMNVDPECALFLREALRFFSPYENDTSNPAGPEIQLFVKPYTAFTRKDIRSHFEPVVIRKSTAGRFNQVGEKAFSDGLEIIDCAAIRTAMAFDTRRKEVHAYISELSEITLIELIRDLVIRSQQGTSLMLHAAGASRGDNAIVICGAKGAGKTTTLLDLLARGGYALLSGDKISLKPGQSGLMAYGWPDYPHLGNGTILRHAPLVKALRERGIDPNPAFPMKKHLVSPDLLQLVFGYKYAPGPCRIKTVLLPDIGSASAPGVRKVDWEEAKTDFLAQLEYPIEDPFAGWNAFIPFATRESMTDLTTSIVRDAARSCDFLKVSGPLAASWNEIETWLC